MDSSDVRHAHRQPGTRRRPRGLGPAGSDRGREAAAREIGTQVERLAWHAVRYGGGLAYPGDMLLRLSMDLGTGTAGVLLGTAAALAPHGATLPFFARPASLPARTTTDSPAAVQGAQDNQALTRR